MSSIRSFKSTETPDKSGGCKSIFALLPKLDGEISEESRFDRVGEATSGVELALAMGITGSGDTDWAGETTWARSGAGPTSSSPCTCKLTSRAVGTATENPAEEISRTLIVPKVMDGSATVHRRSVAGGEGKITHS